MLNHRKSSHTRPNPDLTSHLSTIPGTIALVVPYEYYSKSLDAAGEQLFTERPKQQHQLQGADAVANNHNSHHIPLSYEQLPRLEACVRQGQATLSRPT